MQVPSLGQKDPLEEEIAAHSSILTWKIPQTEEPGGQQYGGGHKKLNMTEWLQIQVGFSSWNMWA